MGKVILVIAAHPDDELLGCAGTIAKHIEEGDEVHSFIMATGASSRSNSNPNSDLEGEFEKLKNAAQSAATMLGVKSLKFFDLCDNQMDKYTLLEIIQCIESAAKEISPNIIYTHHFGDVNIDHSITNRAVYTAFRPTPGSSVERILVFETVSSTEWGPHGFSSFQPNWFVDISETLPLKLAALSEYNSEMRDWPHPRSLEAVKYLAKWRGSTVGVSAAEAFMLLRNVEKVS